MAVGRLRPHDRRLRRRQAPIPVIIGIGGAGLIVMGVLIWTGELFRLNMKAQHLLDSLGRDFLNHV